MHMYIDACACELLSTHDWSAWPGRDIGQLVGGTRPHAATPRASGRYEHLKCQMQCGRSLRVWSP